MFGLQVPKASFRPIVGYPGKNEMRLAFERNEVNVDVQTTPIFEMGVRPLIKAGKAVRSGGPSTP